MHFQLHARTCKERFHQLHRNMPLSTEIEDLNNFQYSETIEKSNFAALFRVSPPRYRRQLHVPQPTSYNGVLIGFQDFAANGQIAAGDHAVDLSNRSANQRQGVALPVPEEGETESSSDDDDDADPPIPMMVDDEDLQELPVLAELLPVDPYELELREQLSVSPW